MNLDRAVAGQGQNDLSQGQEGRGVQVSEGGVFRVRIGMLFKLLGKELQEGELRTIYTKY